MIIAKAIQSPNISLIDVCDCVNDYYWNSTNYSCIYNGTNSSNITILNNYKLLKSSYINWLS
jgi:hypothetical protein